MGREHVVVSSTGRAGDRPSSTDNAPPLIQQASRAAFWNAVLRPVLALFSLVFAVLIRRQFGLFSGVYDVLLGVVVALLNYSSVGIPVGLTKFLPEIDAESDGMVLRRFLQQVVAIRLLLLGVILVPLGIFAEPLARAFDLGAGGPAYLRLLTGLVVARAIFELMVQTLNAFFAQLWSNLLSLARAAIDLALVSLVLLFGYRMAGVLGAMIASSSVVAVLSIGCATWQLRRLGEGRPSEDQQSSEDRPAWLGGHGKRFFQFSGFTYLNGLTGSLMGMGFVAPALALVLTTELVAIFVTAFRLAIMTVGLVVAVFQGIYRPLFVRLRIRNDPSQLQRTFTVVSKAQLLLLLPAGLGLVVMSGDYIPLLFGSAFQPSVPITWVLVCLLYASTAFNLPGIILSVDEQYRAIAWIRLVVIVAAPIFLIVAYAGGLVAAALVFGGARLVSALCAYGLCVRLYGVKFPWAFAGRIGIISLLMAVSLAMTRTVWSTSPVEAITLTIGGVLMFGIGVRVSGSLGPSEVELLNRTGLPGHTWVAAWLVPRAGRGPVDRGR